MTSSTIGVSPRHYGIADKAGALNEITPAHVLSAVALVRRGDLHDLADLLHADVPPHRADAPTRILAAHFTRWADSNHDHVELAQGTLSWSPQCYVCNAWTARESAQQATQ
jgi:hypothetical protein